MKIKNKLKLILISKFKTMAKVKVGNPKDYNLTQGKLYELIQRDGNKLLIINDNNVQAFYYKTVFIGDGAEVKEEAQKPVAVAAPVKPAFPTINAISKTFKYDLDNGKLSFSIDKDQHELELMLGNSGTEVSPAIRQIFHINEFYDSLTEYLENEIEDLTPKMRTEMVDMFFKMSVEAVMKNVKASVNMFVASTNTNYANFKSLCAILDPMSLGKFDKKNLKTGNNIRLWTLNQQF